jgi:hypothetical protein
VLRTDRFHPFFNCFVRISSAVVFRSRETVGFFFLTPRMPRAQEEQEEAPPEAKAGARHSSLVNFLSASISEYVPKISCKLSEDILGCIAAVYCKLSGAEGECCVASPSPSVSSWSTFSPRRRNDSWSPRSRCNNFDSWSPRPCGVEKESGEQSPGVMMVVVPRIRVDADTFEYASKMLETTR